MSVNCLLQGCALNDIYYRFSCNKNNVLCRKCHSEFFVKDVLPKCPSCKKSVPCPLNLEVLALNEQSFALQIDVSEVGLGENKTVFVKAGQSEDELLNKILKIYPKFSTAIYSAILNSRTLRKETKYRKIGKDIMVKNNHVIYIKKRNDGGLTH